jgi:hypothetical protein
MRVRGWIVVWALCVANARGADRFDPLVAVDDVVGHDVPEHPTWSGDVVPALTRAGCAAGACHGSFQGRGGLRLSLLGYDPAHDRESVILASGGRRLNFAAPERSLLLRKGVGEVPHGGGVRFARDSVAARIVRRYIELGAPVDPVDAPQPVALTIVPRRVRLAPGEQATIRAEVRYSDGTARDVTPWVLFDARDEFLCSVDKLGAMRAHSPGKGAITVRYRGLVGVVDVTIPYSEPAPIQGFTPRNFLDPLVLEEWRQLGVAPAPLADDAEFVRRVFGDLIGTLPTPEEARTFVADPSPDKRSRLIDRLLERPEYVDFWAVKWGDLLRVHRRYVGDKGLAAFSGWLREALRENRPLSTMATELLTAKGNVYLSGPVSYYFVDERPEDLAETTAQVFLGVRLQCARCHHHPMEVWSQEDYWGLAANFARLEVKQTQELGGQGRYGGVKVLRVARTIPEKRKLPVDRAPKALGGPTFAVTEEANDPRVALAAWLVDPDNPFFARNIANRYWSYLLGSGLVEQVDDLRDTNPAVMPGVLEALAHDFRAGGYDVKRLLRVICNSRVYQTASRLDPDRDRDGRLFTHRSPRQLPAEVLLDAVNRVLDVSESFAGIPEGTRAIALPDPSIPSDFLTTFGRPQRNSPCECARTVSPNLAQALQLLNSETLQKKLSRGDGRLTRLLAERSDGEVVEELYWWCYSRPPRTDEAAAARTLVTEGGANRREAFEDLLWTLFNSSEFVFSH